MVSRSRSLRLGIHHKPSTTGETTLNPFSEAFTKKLKDSGFVPVQRVHDRETLWRKPGESGILYDTAEAVIQAMKLGS